MVARELLEEGIITKDAKCLAFLSCTKYSHKSQQIKGQVACGRGHLAMLGSTSLHSWATDLNQVHPFLSSKIPVDSTLLDDSGFR